MRSERHSGSKASRAKQLSPRMDAQMLADIHIGGGGAVRTAEALFAKAARVERDDPRQALDMLHEGIRCTLAALEARSGSADDTTADRLNHTLQRLFSRAFELREKLAGLEHH